VPGSASPFQRGSAHARGAAKAWHSTPRGTATASCHDAGRTSGPFTSIYRRTPALAKESAGAITAHAQVSAPGWRISSHKPATSTSFNVAGTDDGKQLRLQLVLSGFRENGASCRPGYGWYPRRRRYLTHPPPRSSPITGPGIAHAQWHIIASHAIGQATVSDRADLTCAACGNAG
jgi:hypothetical protein